MILYFKFHISTSRCLQLYVATLLVWIETISMGVWSLRVKWSQVARQMRPGSPHPGPLETFAFTVFCIKSTTFKSSHRHTKLVPRNRISLRWLKLCSHVTLSLLWNRVVFLVLSVTRASWLGPSIWATACNFLVLSGH